MVEERSGSFPLGVKWFLLNKLFQMRPAEIARMEGVKNPHGVRGMIIRVSDQLRCGEISLFEKDPEEAETAKARLEAQREKDRKKQRERRAQNREWYNARQRERHTAKNKEKNQCPATGGLRP